jgi:hypothetical protein
MTIDLDRLPLEGVTPEDLVQRLLGTKDLEQCEDCQKIFEFGELTMVRESAHPDADRKKICNECWGGW